MEEPEIKVTDRRRSSSEGEALETTEKKGSKPSEAPETTERSVPLPPATFEFLLISLRWQAEMQLGLYPGDGGEASRPADLEGARHTIDLMGVLQHKTKGNLSLEEQRLLDDSLTELRFRYVQAAEKADRMPSSNDRSSTAAPASVEEDMESSIEALLDEAREQFFEDGVENEFSRGLLRLIHGFGNPAVAVLTRLILAENVNVEVAGEALRWLGRTEHPQSYQTRRWLLESALRCSSAQIRDSAALGLASLGDRHAIPYLQDAIARESSHELRLDMTRTLAELQASEPCPSS